MLLLLSIYIAIYIFYVATWSIRPRASYLLGSPFLLLIFYFVIFIAINCVCVCVSMYECMPCECRAGGGQKRASDAPEAGVRGGCELPDISAGNQTEVFYKSSKHS